ncbi:unnamed protein product [Oikopleura dioica]|uniref:Guanylate kinase/L-type calcium channel beta subunit domain-containing protein n=1 Tax=Oikopleura dioica TaxID=34765 RepID=E4X9Z6_OIKDI|nr:unnamed protein product [Oikopleura dioica]
MVERLNTVTPDRARSEQVRPDQLEKIIQKRLEQGRNGARYTQRASVKRSKSVLFTVKTSVGYNGKIEDDAPLIGHGKFVSFEPDDFLHIKEKYDEFWWIGRVVSPDSELGFIPSPTKIESIRSNQRGRNPRSTKISAKNGSTEQSRQVLYEKEGVSKKESKSCYEVVPNVRPIVMVGPSLKGYEVTDMMQKAVFDFIRRRFDGRVNITRISADLSQARQADRAIKEKGQNKAALMEVQAEVERIFDLARDLQLVVIDADMINHPNQIAKTHLSPIIARFSMQIKINSLKVLQRLIKSRGKGQSRHTNPQIVAAEKLSQCCPEVFDVTLDENSLDDACDHLAEYLEAYWRTLHPEWKDPATKKQKQPGAFKRSLSFLAPNKPNVNTETPDELP